MNQHLEGSVSFNHSDKEETQKSWEYLSGVLADIIVEAKNADLAQHIGEIVVAGGTVLCARQIRPTSMDLDIKVPPALVAIVERVAKRHPDVVIDVTTTEYFWGQVRVPGEPTRPSVKVSPGGGLQFEVQTLSLETLFVLKAISGRDKDITDCHRMALANDPVGVPPVTPESIAKRFSEIMRYRKGDLDKESWQDLADLVVGAIDESFPRPPDKLTIVTPELLPHFGFTSTETRRFCARMSDMLGFDEPHLSGKDHKSPEFSRELAGVGPHERG